MMPDTTQIGSAIAGAMFVWAIFREWFPKDLRGHLEKHVHKLISYIYPYLQITFHEYQGDEFERNKAYVAIERYLSTHSSDKAKRLKASLVKDSKSVVLCMDDHEEVTDDFAGVKIWWTSSKNVPQQRALFSYRDDEERRFYTLTCHRRDRGVVTKSYLNHVLEEGKAIEVRTRQRKLYTNNKIEGWSGYKRTMWSHVLFEHPSTFDTLAMDPAKKTDILNDLTTFSKSRDYYKKVGKSWKRGYLLHGPPGTGKSSMIAAMANFLEYDIYDLELTSVKDNTDLRKLLIDTSSKSIVVIEDIDCSLDLTGQRTAKKKKNKDGDGDEKDPIRKKAKEAEETKNKGSEVTLSGLLNFIDGLWSACGSERLIVFTTNYIEKLDPALIRRGRMDKHIELSYCCFETFKVLARNYLDIESHELFGVMRRLLEEIDMTPADVAENLMPKSGEETAESCLMKLVRALESAKEEARVKAEEEGRKEGEEDGEKVQVGDAEAEKEGDKVQVNKTKENGVIIT